MEIWSVRMVEREGEEETEDSGGTELDLSVDNREREELRDLEMFMFVSSRGEGDWKTDVKEEGGEMDGVEEETEGAGTGFDWRWARYLRERSRYESSKSDIMEWMTDKEKNIQWFEIFG